MNEKPINKSERWRMVQSIGAVYVINNVAFLKIISGCCCCGSVLNIASKLLSSIKQHSIIIYAEYVGLSSMCP